MVLFKKKSEEEYAKEAIKLNNIFEGIECNVIFPDTQLKVSTYSGVTKGIATLTFGLVGLAATSGIKHNEENRKLSTIMQVVEKGIVFKKATSDQKDLRIPYDNVICVEKNSHRQLVLKLLQNQDIKIGLRTTKPVYSKYVGDHFLNTVNERACGAQYEEAGWGLEYATAEPTETKQESSSLMDELERLGNMYEKGLLTDEEFAAMKKKLIE